MSHSRAVAAMLLATLLWSMAGVVTRHLQSAGSFEATFWRSFFNAAALVVLLGWLRGWRTLAATLRSGGVTLWLSGACWSVMFTAFMVAITMTTVANVLVTMAIVPLVTALVARFALGHRLPARTWAAVLVAGVGIAWMYANEVAAADAAAPRRHRGGARRADRRGDQLDRDPEDRPRRQRPAAGGADRRRRLLPRDDRAVASPSPPPAPTWRCSACSASPSWRFPA